MHDEQSDREGKEAEGCEVQVKAVGEAGKVALHSGRAPHQAGRHLRQGPCLRRLLRRDQQARQLPRRVEQLLRDADVGQRGARRQPFGDAQRRGLCSLQPLRRLARHDEQSRRRDEGRQPNVGSSDIHLRGLRRQRHRIDAEDAQTLGPEALLALEHGRHQPASLAQRDVVGLRDSRAIGMDELFQPVLAHHRSGARIARPRLAIDRLHGGPQRRGQRQSQHQHGELQLVPPPVRQEDGEALGEHQSSRPAAR